MSKFHKLNGQMLTMGSVALIVSAGAMAGTPTSPVTTLSQHTALACSDGPSESACGVSGLSYAIDGTVGFTNGQLSSVGTQHAAMCSQVGFTCTLMDGSGEGMLQYEVTDSTGKSHIELIVGTDDGNGIFLSDTFVRYNGATSLDSMANKMIIEDSAAAAAIAALLSTTPGATQAQQENAAGLAGGFYMNAEWQHGDYETNSNGFIATNASGGEAATTATFGGGGDDLNAIVNQIVGGVQTFHFEGTMSENGAAFTEGGGGLVDIQQGTTAANTTGNDPGSMAAIAMGQFHTIEQGGYSLANGNFPGINYAANSTTSPNIITLGGNNLTLNPGDGVSATYIHVNYGLTSDGTDGPAETFGFNGTYATNYTQDNPQLRDFAFITINDVPSSVGAGVPTTSTLGNFADPTLGIGAGTALTYTSQDGGSTSTLVASGTTSTTATNPGFVNLLQTVGNGAPTSWDGPGGNFTTSNVTAIQGAWTSIFGSGP